MTSENVEEEVVNGLVCILTTVLYYAITLDVLLTAYFGHSDHQVAEEGFIFCCLFHIIQRMQTKLFCQEDQVDLSRLASRWEHNNFVILVDHIFHGRLTFDYFVKGRILKLIQGDFRLLHLWLVLLAFFWLRSPLAHSKDWTSLAKLSENQICVLVKV